MKLLLITASSKEIKIIRKSRVIGFQQCTMPYLAALTSSSWEIEHVDEEIEKVDFSRDYDLVAIPGTPLFRRLEKEGRILTNDWSKYNTRTDVVFNPRLMSAEELIEGFNWANKRFYSLKSIAKRLSKSPAGLYWTLPLNLMYHCSLKLNSYKFY